MSSRAVNVSRHQLSESRCNRRARVSLFSMEKRAYVTSLGIGAYPPFFEIRPRARRAVDLSGLVQRAVSPAALEKNTSAFALPKAAACSARLGSRRFVLVQALAFIRDSLCLLLHIRISHVPEILVAPSRVLSSALVISDGSPIALVRLGSLS